MSEQIEIWGGIECTVNRVGDQYFDQLKWNGHTVREGDLERFAHLGIRTIRYPLLWERIAPDGLKTADWGWADRQLDHLRRLGIRPIAGLLHHGSGPRNTSLVDPDFPLKLAEYACALAERYPWLDAYTPVNEPLTTARFSGLYGHWYPHGRDDYTFCVALLAQVRGIQLAMRAIRQVNPQAQLIQTEDLGKIYSTAELDYQADYENTRRWLSLDLLAGRMTPRHSLYEYFPLAGVDERLLRAAAEDPCPPDLIGLNYYITGERFLDHRLERYPPITHGGNGIDAYADVEAVRVVAEGVVGAGSLLQEAWDRYHLPLAVSEVHLGATREEQLRWLVEIWNEVRRTRARGVDVRALTVWSLLGTYNWQCLVTRDENQYEPGVFDLRSPQPRATVLAQAVQQLAQGKPFDHPVLDTPGWWRRPERLLYPPAPRRDEHAYSGAPKNLSFLFRANTGHTRSLLITGARGALGYAFRRLCSLRGLTHMDATRQTLDIGSLAQVEKFLDENRPWAIINTAGYVRVDLAEREPERCFRENSEGPSILAAACAQRGIRLLTFSSDLVFDGASVTPYTEAALTAPLNVYGCSKARGEAEVLERLPQALVVRTSAFFGPWDESNFLYLALHALRHDRFFQASEDVRVSPTYLPDLVNACLDLLIDGESGLWHIANRGETDWAQFARLGARHAGVDPAGLVSATSEELGWEAPRPRYSVLGSERGLLLPDLEHAVARFAAHFSAGV